MIRLKIVKLNSTKFAHFDLLIREIKFCESFPRKFLPLRYVVYFHPQLDAKTYLKYRRDEGNREKV